MKRTPVLLATIGTVGLTIFAYFWITSHRGQGSEAPAVRPSQAAGANRAPSVTNAVQTSQVGKPGAASQFVRPDPSSTKLEISPANEELLNEIGNYPKLEILVIRCLENLPALPDDVGKLMHLKELNMDEGNGCAMNPVLPESFGNLSSLERLILDGAQDPTEVTERESRPRDRHRFPASMSNLKNLTYLSLGRNGMQEIPTFVKDLHQLQVLDFSWNMDVNEIPSFLTDLRELTTLRLESDGLTDLPQFLNELPNLRKINLGNNCSITQNPAKRQDLQRRFPKITFNFDDEYDCPEAVRPVTTSPSK